MRVVRSALVVSLCTAASRIAGFCRDVVFSRFLGANSLTDAVFFALKLPNFFRRFLGEGALNSAFVPMLTKIKHEKGGLEAEKFASEINIFLLSALVIITLLAEIFMPTIVTALAPGFLKDPEKFQNSVILSRITFPYMIQICITAFYGGILNTMGRFFYFAIMPLIFNLSAMFMVLLFPSQFKSIAYNIAYGTIIAGFLQLVIVIYGLFKSKFNLRFDDNIFKRVFVRPDKNILAFLKRLAAGSLGAGVMQINILIDGLLASFFAGAVSYFYYAERVYQLPLSLIATTISTVLLPYVSKQVVQKNSGKASEDHGNMEKQQINSILSCLMIVIPASCGLILLSNEIIVTLFENKNFTHDTAMIVALVLAIMSVALPFNSLAKIYTNYVFAQGDTKSPAKIAVVCLLVNAGMGYLLIHFISFYGICVATVLSAITNMTLIMYLLKKRGILAYSSFMFKMIARILVLSGVMCAIIYYCKHLELHLFISIPIAMGVYFAGSIGCIKKIRSHR